MYTMSGYVVVRFFADNSVEIISSAWTIDQLHAYWPPYKDKQQLQNAVRTHEPVNRKEWTVYKMLILCATSM